MLIAQLQRGIAALVVLSIAVVVTAGCGGDGSSSDASAARTTRGGNVKLALVAYSTPREAFERIIPAFQKTDAGAGVEITQSYGASGDQSRAVEGGLAADVLDLSLEPDLQRLVDAGKVSRDWASNEHDGIVTDSVVVLVVRKGNPKRIDDWDDLLEKGVEVVTPNPFTSGGARWNLMAAYGAWTRAGAKPDEALAKLKQLLRNTPVQAASAREALETFSQGKGDVMIGYENEAITAQRAGQPLEFVIPKSTILIENPGAVLATSRHPEQAQAFLDFIWSAEGQRIFGEHGYRPVVPEVLDAFDFEVPKDLFTIEDLGGWPKVMTEFFDRDAGRVAKIQRSLGVATDG